jgi:hypothetical protein
MLPQYQFYERLSAALNKPQAPRFFFPATNMLGLPQAVCTDATYCIPTRRDDLLQSRCQKQNSRRIAQRRCSSNYGGSRLLYEGIRTIISSLTLL